jgi:hypothetical protein
VLQVGDLAEDLMANSTASIFIKPTVAFNHGDTFVFGSWVCTANSGGVGVLDWQPTKGST